MAYTKTSKQLKPTKGASVSDFDDTVAKYTPYKMKASGHNNSPIEKNYGSKSDRGFGVPFTGGVGSNEMESGVGDKFEGMPYSKNASPAKGWFSNAIKKVKGVAKKAMDPFGLAGKAKNALGIGGGVKTAAAVGGDTAELEARVSALEEGSGGGGEVELSTTDPMLGGAGAAGVADPSKLLTKEEMKKKSMKTGWGGTGDIATQAATVMSDIRAKEKIERTGKSPSGIPTYEFNYIGDNNRYSGVMAQDLLEMNIDAVSMGDDGFYRVNYNNIDVDMHLIN